jgi:similar to stage IV sporulation protein
VRIHGPGELLVNAALKAGLRLYRVRRDGDILLARVQLGDFPKLWHLSKKTSCRLRPVGKQGMPFAWRRLRRRPLVPLAALVLVGAIAIMTRFVWLVEVRGNLQVNTAQVQQTAAALGLRPGVLTRALDLQAIERRLVLDIPRVAWVQVRVQGIRAIIDIVEQVRPEVPLMGPGDVVSRRDGIIASVLVLEGEAVVSPGQTVTAGQLLIRGGDGRPGGPGRARGEVRARVWHQAYVEVSYSDLVTSRTGRTWVRQVVAWLDREIIWEGREPVPFPAYELSVTRRALVAWRNIRVPVELVTYTYHEVEMVERQLQPEEALRRARALTETAVRERLPPGAEAGELAMEVVPGEGTVGVRATLASVEEIGVFRPASPP